MFGKNLKRIRESHNLNQDELGEKLGVSGKTISSWEINRTEPNMGQVQKIADMFKISTDDLIREGNISDINDSTVREPIYAEISCGTGSYEDGEIIGWISLPSHMVNPRKKYFGNVAKGDSMTGAGINDGDILIFEVDNAPEDGQIGSFCIDEDLAVCKRFKRGSGGVVYLMSANDAYSPIVIDPENTCFRMVGLLAFVINDRRDK